MDIRKLKTILTTLVMFSLLTCGSAQAQNRVVVIPLFGEDPPEIENVVVVAKTGGDFTDPISAMNSINDASQNKPYLIVIAPGTYSINQTLQVKPNVSIAGSSESNTIIRNSDPNNGTTLSFQNSGNDAISLSNITIKNDSGGSECTAIFSASFATFDKVTAIASGCTSSNTAMEASLGGVISNMTLIATGGNRATGLVHSLAGSLALNNVNVYVVGNSESYGILSYFAYFDINNSSITTGVQNGTAHALKMKVFNYVGVRESRISNSTIRAFRNSGSGATIGVHVSDETKVYIQRSTISADTASLFADTDSSIIVSASILEGSTTAETGNTGIKKCVHSDDGEGNALNPQCGTIAMGE